MPEGYRGNPCKGSGKPLLLLGLGLPTFRVYHSHLLYGVSNDILRESDIVFEAGNVWVGKVDGTYTVYRAGVTHSTPDSSYAPTEDGKSVAIARAKYLAAKPR